MTKKIYGNVRIRFSAIAHLQKAPITASLSNKKFQVIILENIHITKSYIIK